MFNVFGSPFETSTLEAWAKMADDIAKVAILALPVMLYGNDPNSLKILNSFLLIVGVYSGLFIGRYLRRQIEEKNQ